MPTTAEDEIRLLTDVTTSRSRRIRNRVATAWMIASLILVLIPLGFVVGYVVVKGIGVDGSLPRSKSSGMRG